MSVTDTLDLYDNRKRSTYLGYIGSREFTQNYQNTHASTILTTGKHCAILFS